MKRTLILFAAGLVSLTLTGCSLSLLRISTPVPTLIPLASPTPLLATLTTAASPTPSIPSETPTLSLPTVTPLPAVPTVTTGAAPTTVTDDTIPGSPSGPYGVIQVAPGDVLNIHAAAGAGSTVIGSFTATANTVMRAGPWTAVGEDHWVQVLNPGGGSGWVNAAYLTEYITPATFCADGRVTTLLSTFSNAIKTSNGGALYMLVSPVHGMAVRLWRSGNVVVFDQSHAQWIFESTYEHRWGAAPGSGLDTVGAIHAVVIPKWLDVLNGSYTLSCNAPRPVVPVTIFPGRQSILMSTSIHSTNPARSATNSPGGPC
jgi:hypothetical protein